MTVKTRRRLIACAIAVAVTIPVEAVLVQAIAEPDAQVVVQTWAASLDASSLEIAASYIQYYPLLYRKEIMRALPPESRAGVWRRHLQSYLASHPGLDPNAVSAIEAAMALATPETFSRPTAAVAEQTRLVGQQIQSLLGREEAVYLLYRLGPRDGTFASIEPMRHKLVNYVRGLVVAMAEEGGDCDCNQGFGCDGYYTHCADGNGCTPDTVWPMCGWFWNEECDGVCKVGIQTLNFR